MFLSDFFRQIKPGWKTGTKITFKGEGDELPGRPAADICFVLKEKPDSSFTRDGNNLVYKVKSSPVCASLWLIKFSVCVQATIPLRDALLGTTLSVTTLDDRKLSIPADYAKPGAVKIVLGEGMPISKAPGTKGDLIVKFDVAFPQSLTDSQKAKIREARL